MFVAINKIFCVEIHYVRNDVMPVMREAILEVPEVAVFWLLRIAMPSLMLSRMSCNLHAVHRTWHNFSGSLLTAIKQKAKTEFILVCRNSSSVALQSLQGPWPPHTGGFIILLKHTAGLLRTSDQPVAKASTYTQDNTTHKHK
jgi:hypothetical protein